MFLKLQKNKLSMTAMIAGFLIVGCNPNAKFSPIPESSLDNAQNVLSGSGEFEDFYSLKVSEETINQETLDTNISTLSFKVKTPNGKYLQNLSKNDLEILENGGPLSQFNLTKNSMEFKQTVDIAFAVDVTGSMTSTIESAKIRLVNFVNNSRKAGYHTRMCLITFGDYTVQKCDKFYDNDPTKPETRAQVDELISEITKLKALKGAQDPGGKDLNENPMRALIDASKANWEPDHQKFLILITDNGFLYSPGNPGKVGALAPKYDEVKAALDASQMKVFAATPSLAGYNKKFGSDLGVVQYSQGEWFNFNDLISGKITLDTILNSIITNVNTTFIASYVVDENENLDASLGLSKRKIKIKLKNGVTGTVESLQLASNLPEGRKPYKSEFKITSKKIKTDQAKVTVNGTEIKSGFTITKDGLLKFNKTPAPGAIIKVQYQYAQLKDAVIIKPVVFSSSLDITSVTVFLNGIELDPSHFNIEKSIEGKFSLVFTDDVLSDSDPYKIFEKNGLQISIKYVYNEE